MIDCMKFIMSEFGMEKSVHMIIILQENSSEFNENVNGQYYLVMDSRKESEKLRD